MDFHILFLFETGFEQARTRFGTMKPFFPSVGACLLFTLTQWHSCWDSITFRQSAVYSQDTERFRSTLLMIAYQTTIAGAMLKTFKVKAPFAPSILTI